MNVSPVNPALIVGLPLAASLLLAVGGPRSRDGAALLSLVATLAAALAVFSLGPPVFAGQVPAWSTPWLPLAGADLGFRVDGLAWLFTLLITGIGALVVLYARYYLGPEEAGGRFFACFTLFMGSMLGVVLADNLLLLAIFWELTGLASFLLIGFWQHRADARQGARVSLAVTAGGGLALLAGALLLGEMAGSLKLDVVLTAGETVRNHPAYLPALVLVLLGAFTKSAQFPFHFWLPQAMAAPTPVSAYLHSATLVKAGVFLLARLYPVLAGTDEWFYLVGTTGLVTLLAGAWIAIFQHDLKGLLAYSTISHLGLITLLFGLNSRLGAVAAVFHILNHATFKASLFMAAGIIDHETGSRDMRRLHGLWKYMPVTGALAVTSSLAMAGVPLLNGFLSKEMFLAETLVVDDHPWAQVLVPVLATVASAFAVAYSARFVHDVFWNGEPRGIPRTPHEPPAWMLVPVGVLAGLCIVVGVAPALVIGPLLAVAATATLGGDLPAYKLVIWHGLNLPLVMSLGALVLGVLLYLSLQRIFRLHDRVHLPRGGKELHDLLLARLVRVAEAVTRRLESGRSQHSIGWAFTAAIVAGGLPLVRQGLTGGNAPGTPSDPTLVAIWALALAVTVALVWHAGNRLLTLLLAGAVGLAVSLTFAWLSAPDLALTQLLVEVATVILMLLALNFLPARAPADDGGGRWWRAALAVTGGLGVAGLTWAVLTRPQTSIADYFLANAVPGAAGSNAVNVIIVDFRGLDTLGEITVLVIAALVAAGLLVGLRPTPAPGSTSTPVPAGSLILEQAATLLLPLCLVVGIYLFLRGHNLPGGGFIAGLVLSAGLLLPYLARGSRWVEERLSPDYTRLMGLGLLTAATTGAASLALRHPFLTSSYLAPELPVIGKVSLASAMFFDLGVLLAVCGATLLALTRLGQLHRRTGEAAS